MANTEISERAILFEYGFLTSRTSRILSNIIKTRCSKLNSQDKNTIEHARDFIVKILKEGSFISGGLEDGTTPDFDRLTTFNRALCTLEALQSLPKTSEDVREYFESIKDTLNKTLEDSLKDVKTLEPANNFFSKIADMVLEELSSTDNPDFVFR